MSSTLLVVGAGTMGAGIAQVAVQAGWSVYLFDVAPGAAARGVAQIGKRWDKEVEKGRMTAADREAAIARLAATDKMTAAEVVIEAVKEDLGIKQMVFGQLEAAMPATTLLLTNTSMISVTRIAEGLKHPERVAGCHFFNPVPRMALVEVIAGERTSPETITRVDAMVTAWGKTPVRAPNTPGFIVNRVLMMLLNEAALLAQAGTPCEAVDTAMKLGCNFPMGPLALIDLIGVDVTLDCLTALWEQFDRNPKYEPCSLLREMVKAGKRGCKSGQGFYVYSNENR